MVLSDMEVLLLLLSSSSSHPTDCRHQLLSCLPVSLLLMTTASPFPQFYVHGLPPLLSRLRG